MKNSRRFSLSRLRWIGHVVLLTAQQWLWIGFFFIKFETNLLPAAVLLGFFLILGVELAHHRYFAHRAFTTSRVFQFVLAIWATAAFQRDVLWWACMHRKHHRFSDTPDDPHSPYHGGFLHAYILWGIDKRNAIVDKKYVRDLLAYPELRLLGKLHYLVNLIYALVAFSIGHWGWVQASGLQSFLWLYVLPHFICQNVISAEATFMHDAPHLLGAYRNFKTKDKSTNHVLIGLVSCGGGFHNNHHRFPGSARIGLKRYEVDIAYFSIKILEQLRLVHKISVPRAAQIYASGQVNSDRNLGV